MAQISHFKGAPSNGGSPFKRVFLATPTYTGKLDAQYLHSLLHSMERMRALGIEFEHYVMSHNCHVDDSRNSIVRDFLLSSCTELVFLDADVHWAPDALVKLVSHDRDVVAGVYPKRSQFDLEFPVRVEPGTTLIADADGLVEVSGAPTGFMKIKRNVLDALVKANSHRQFQGRSNGNDPNSKELYTIVFERTYQDGHRWSGDYNFCRQWQKLGGKVFVDPYLELSHLGEVSFSGTLGDYWKEKHGVTREERERGFQEALQSIRSGTATPETWLKIQAWNKNPYAAQVDLLSALYETVKGMGKAKVLELGTGLSTLVMALANPKLEIHSLEHETIWAGSIRYLLDMNGIQNVTIHHKPLKEYPEGKWYDPSGVPECEFDLVLCDGPPRKISNRNILYKKLGHLFKKSILFMDDADDDQATLGVRNWSEQNNRECLVLGKLRKFALSFPKKKGA